MDNQILEGKKTDTLDATSAPDETDEVLGGNNEAAPSEEVEDKVELNSSPVPTAEEVNDAGLDVADDNQVPTDNDTDPADETEASPLGETEPTTPEEPAVPESDTPEAEPVASEPVNDNLVCEENGVTDTPATKMFTQSQVDDIAGKTRTETREKTFRYIYDRYGVNSEAELDDLIGNAQRYDSLKEEYDGAKASWKQNSADRDNELASIKEQVALMQSGIDEGRYDDAKFILKGKGLEVNLDNIKSAMASHPEWRKSEAGEEPNPNFVKTGPDKNTANAEPVSKLSVLGNETEPQANPKQSEEDYAMRRMFKV